jgi:hypothetical protein
VAVVPEILYQDFVRTPRTHPVIKSISATRRFAFDVIQGRGVNDRPR